MKSASFRAEGGHGQASGTVDFTVSPPLLSAALSLAGASVQPLVAHLPGPARSLRGSVNAVGDFHTRGTARGDLAQNLTGRMELRVRDISFGDFDPLGTLAQQAHWGKLEPARTPVTALPTTLDVEISNRHLTLKSMALDLSGARLHCSGDYAWAGAMNLNVHADLRGLRRRGWQERMIPTPLHASRRFTWTERLTTSRSLPTHPWRHWEGGDQETQCGDF